MLETKEESLIRHRDNRQGTLQRMVEAFRLQTKAKETIVERLAQIIEDPSRLTAFAVDLSQSQRRALMEVVTGAGIDHNTHTGRPLLRLWNNDGCEEARYHFSQVRHLEWDPEKRFHYQSGPLPCFQAIWLDRPEGAGWDLGLTYYDLFNMNLAGDVPPASDT